MRGSLRISLISLILALSCPFSYGQEPDNVPKVEDSVRQETEVPLNIPLNSFVNPSLTLPSSAYAAPESKEDAANRLNLQVYEAVMKSVGHNLDSSKPKLLPENISKEWKIALTCAMYLASFFLTPQFSVPYGYYSMDHTNPFLYVKIPGWAPDENAGKYSPERIPQCIKAVYDPATGTYKQVGVDWKTVEGYKYDFNPDFRTQDMQPVPVRSFNSVEKQVFRR